MAPADFISPPHPLGQLEMASLSYHPKEWLISILESAVSLGA